MSLRHSLRLLLPVCALAVAGCPNGSGSGPGDDDDDVDSFDPVAPGSFVITEIHADPETGRPEYVEVYNATAETMTLRGCEFGTGGAASSQFVITGEADVGPGEYALLGDQEFLGDGEELPALVVWGDAINIAQTDDTETVSLSCPNGEGGRVLTDIVGFDPTLGWEPRKGHSWQLVGDPDATMNDVPSNWCEAPTQDNTNYASVDGQPEYGTPGGPTICEQLGGLPPTAFGDLVIVEIAVAPCAGTREWVEIHNPGAEAVDIRRCQLVDEPVDLSTEADVHVIDAERGDTVIPPGGVLLLNSSPSADITFDITGNGSLLGDYPYANGISFKNTDPQTLYIECPLAEGGVVEIDRIVYDWEEQGEGFTGRTLSLDPASWNAEDNDDFSSWCLSDADAYNTVKGCEDVGSPGLANPSCPVPDPFPQPGDLVFTEIMALSQSAIGSNEEWLELKNTTSTTLGLEGCTLEVDDGSEVDSHPISSPLGVSVEADDYFVMVKSSASDTIDDCALPWDYLYGTNLNFSNSNAETISLVCPGDGGTQVIDSFSYDFDTSDPRGVSWQLRTNAETAVDNDNTINWCFDDPSTAAFTWMCTVDEESNVGTPGGPSTCGAL